MLISSSFPLPLWRLTLIIFLSVPSLSLSFATRDASIKATMCVHVFAPPLFLLISRTIYCIRWSERVSGRERWSNLSICRVISTWAEANVLSQDKEWSWKRRRKRASVAFQMMYTCKERSNDLTLSLKYWARARECTRCGHQCPAVRLSNRIQVTHAHTHTRWLSKDEDWPPASTRMRHAQHKVNEIHYCQIE